MAMLKKFMPLDNIVGEVIESFILGSIWMIGYVIFMKKRIITSWEVLNHD
jgi:hypothetical protein